MEPAIYHELDHVPSGLLQSEPEELYKVLPVPTLIHLPGRVERPLFVSVLLHGNETTGLRAVQRLLEKHAGRLLPRALALFIGNIAGTRAGKRRLDEQVDYNRIWPGHTLLSCPETEMARRVYDSMARRRPFACVDVHNNTGLNPHYSCVDCLDSRILQLAAMFSRLCIYSTYPKGTLSAAFAALCPAVTVECGKPDQQFGVDHAFGYLDACLHLSHIPDHAVAPRDLELYESIGQVQITGGVTFGFDAPAATLNLLPGLDRLNFTPVPAGFLLGYCRDQSLPLRVIREDGCNVADEYFAVDEGRLITRRPLMPSMLSTDVQVVRQDCLGYLMARIE